MLSVSDTKKIADKKCIEIFGKDFCKKYGEYGGSAYEDQKMNVRFFYGMNDEIPKPKSVLCLTEEKYKYILILDVDKDKGNVTIIKSIVPSS